MRGQATLTWPAAIPRLRWRWIGVAVYIGFNVALLIAFALGEPDVEHADWELWRALGDRPMYDTDTRAPFVWSPVAGWFMTLVPEVLGHTLWAALHFAALLLLRDWRLIGLVLISIGFWGEIAGGNTMTFVFVAGVLALRGSRPAALVYLVLLFLMPRPIQAPLAVWLLWTMPNIRWPAAGLFVMHAVLVLASGLTLDWFSTMLGHGDPAGNFAPSAVIGTVPWLAIGVPIGAWLTWKGRVGWAGLAVNPYWLLAYLFVLLWELVPRQRSASAQDVIVRSTASASASSATAAD